MGSLGRDNTKSEIVKQRFFWRARREISRALLDKTHEVIHVTSVVSMRRSTLSRHYRWRPTLQSAVLIGAGIASTLLCLSHQRFFANALPIATSPSRLTLHSSSLTMRNFGRKLIDKARSTLDIAHPSQPSPSGVTQLHPQSVQSVNISGNIISELS